MRLVQDLPLRYKLLIAFGVVLAVLAALSAAAFRFTLNTREASQRVERTHEVIALTDVALLELISMETGYRGFLITGKDEYLDVYRQGKDRYRVLLSDLRSATADNPPQLRRWLSIEQRADTWQREVTEPGIAQRRAAPQTGDVPAAIIERVSSGEGKVHVEGIRKVFAEAIATERDLLAKRNAANDAATASLQTLLIWGTIGAIGLGMGIAICVERSITGAVVQVAAAARRIARDDLPVIVATLSDLAMGRSEPRPSISTQRVHVPGRNELGMMAQDVNHMIDRLAETGRDVEQLAGAIDQAKRTAADERDTLRATLEASQDAVVILDAAGRLRLSNRRFEDWFGITAVRVQRESVAFGRQVVAPLDRSSEFAAWADQVIAQHDRTERRLARFLEGPVTEADCFSAPVNSIDGAYLGRVFVFHDISREAELGRVKDELVSVVSHELRTPLASLVGFAELLLTRDYSVAQQRQFLTIIREEGQRLTALINDFLDLQRVETNRQSLVRAPTSLRPLVDRVVSTAGDDFAHPIVVEMPDGLPPAMADADRIQQVLANLVSNARKFSPEGGSVAIAVQQIENTLEIAVSDSGLGLPPEAIPNLFQKFYRVDNSDRRAIKGTGLGLAICQQIVAAHGGRIWAESAGLGRGSRFTFTLPVSENTAGTGAVLIVEDDAGFARLLEVELAALGLSANRAASAEAALDQIALNQPYAVVLDLLLPGLPGEAFLARLRDSGSLSVPVIIVTVKDLNAREREELEHLGAVAVLRKGPGTAAQAAAAVGRALALPTLSSEGYAVK